MGCQGEAGGAKSRQDGVAAGNGPWCRSRRAHRGRSPAGRTSPTCTTVICRRGATAHRRTTWWRSMTAPSIKACCESAASDLLLRARGGAGSGRGDNRSAEERPPAGEQVAGRIPLTLTLEALNMTASIRTGHKVDESKQKTRAPPRRCWTCWPNWWQAMAIWSGAAPASARRSPQFCGYSSAGAVRATGPTWRFMAVAAATCDRTFHERHVGPCGRRSGASRRARRAPTSPARKNSVACFAGWKGSRERVAARAGGDGRAGIMWRVQVCEA